MNSLFPAGSESVSEQMKLSPGLVSGDFVFVTGMTGSTPNGMPGDPAEQFRRAFDKINSVLAEADLTFGDVVEMTSYHIDIADHFDLFSQVRADYVTAPYPAWTAIEVAGLRRAGALVEIRVVARLATP